MGEKPSQPHSPAAPSSPQFSNLATNNKEEAEKARDQADAVLETLDPATQQDAVESSQLTYPEGGTEAWCVVLGSFCAMLSVFGLPNTAAVFESYFSQNQLQERTPSELGWIFSVYLFVVYLLGLLVGPVFDKYGPRALVAAGSVVMVASLVLLSFCSGKIISISPWRDRRKRADSERRILPNHAHLLDHGRPRCLTA